MDTRAIAGLTVLLLSLGACSQERPSRSEQPPAAATQQAAPTEGNPLYDPTKATEKAPDTFKVRLVTTKGEVVIQASRSWAPYGVDRFYNLVKIGYFDNTAFFRVRPGFIAQFGINGDKEVNRAWVNAQIPDDPVKESNRRGYVSFATAGPDTRTTQLFVNYRDNSSLDQQGFAPIGRVLQGMPVLESLYSGYPEGPPYGKGPNQKLIEAGGNAYLERSFPKLDYIKSAKFEK
jgi:peptidyl-prolyl cis-trans isomerase A (cyclophilin A)